MPIVPRKKASIVAFIYRRGFIVAADSRITVAVDSRIIVERIVEINTSKVKFKIFRFGSSMVCTLAVRVHACRRSIDMLEQSLCWTFTRM